MKRITVRLPEDIVFAFDEADGNRSALMREVLSKHVANGKVDVPDRIQKLARAERAKQKARWDVKDAGLRGRAYRFVVQRWDEGTHDPDAMDRALTGFREEAESSEDPGAEEYIRRLMLWYRDSWPTSNVESRPDFPDAARFHDGVPTIGPTKGESLTVKRARDAIENSETQKEAFELLKEKMPPASARAAIAEVETQ